jgi:hypothetical protein
VVQAGECHRAGDRDEAERIVREGLREQPDCADAVLLLARLLLEQERGTDALQAIEQYASYTRTPADRAAAEFSVHSETLEAEFVASGRVAGGIIDGERVGDDDVFGSAVSAGELDHAFSAAESDTSAMLDADAVAQHAIRQVDGVDLEDFRLAESSFATRTMAGLLEQQGDAEGALEIREAVESTASSAGARPDRWAATIRELERWLGNLNSLGGGLQ